MRPSLAAWMTAAALALAAAGTCAQGSLEIIPLRHRTPEQVLPVLRPLLEPGGVLTSHSNQLIVRTSPRNLEQIKSALAAIDLPLRRLLISVRFGGASAFAAREVEIRGALRPGGARAELRAIDSSGAAGERVDQRVQVLEGGRAMIAIGQSRPLGGGAHEVRDLATGFTLVPRVSGQRVFLEIEPQRELPGTFPGSVDSQRVATTVSAGLGQWVELGGVDSSGAVSEHRSIWVKVEEIGP
jgi:hypothetical protein